MSCVMHPHVSWDEPIQRFRDLSADPDAGRVYVWLLESARRRWETAVGVHAWGLDVELGPTPRDMLRFPG